MKPLIPILVVATTFLAVASVQFARQAATERARADHEMTLRQKSEARVVELERAQSRIPAGFGAADDVPLAAAADTAPPPGMGNSPSGPPGREARAALTNDPAGPPPPRELANRMPRIMDSPAARKFMQSRTKSSLRRLYEDVGTAVGLSTDKANQLIELLAEQQTRNMGRPLQPADGQSMQQYFADMQKKNESEITALIGQDKADEWQAYQRTLPQRSQLNQVREQLDGAGVPMTDSQRNEMLAAISEESERNPRPTYNTGLAPEEAAAQMNQWQAEYDKALMERAKSVLTSEQFKTYKEYQDWQAEMRNAFQNRRGRGGPVGGVAMDTAVAVPFIAVAPAPAPDGN